MAFAKLFGSDDNQVLVMIDSGDDGPEVRLSFKPQEMGVCSFAARYDDTDEGWDSAEAFFDSVTEEVARKIVANASLGMTDLT